MSTSITAKRLAHVRQVREKWDKYLRGPELKPSSKGPKYKKPLLLDQRTNRLSFKRARKIARLQAVDDPNTVR